MAGSGSRKDGFIPGAGVRDFDHSVMLAEYKHSYHVTNRVLSGESFKYEKRALQADEKAVLRVEQQINYRSKSMWSNLQTRVSSAPLIVSGALPIENEAHYHRQIPKRQMESRFAIILNEVLT